MQGKRIVMMKVLMNRFHQGAPNVLLAPLPAEISKEVIEQEIASQDAAQAVLNPLDIIKNRIHYSWLQPALEGFNLPMRSLLISSLPKQNADSLSSLTSTPIVEEPSPMVQAFLLRQLYEKLHVDDVLPAAFLPETPLAPLLDLTKIQLIELIDYLSIYDLTQELRQIVDKETIKAINSTLTQKQQRYLKICLHRKEKVAAPKIGLKNWKGDSDQLSKLLHRRGLLRLGGALSGQNPSLIWYIVHRLDKVRGLLLENSCGKKEIPGASSVLVQQVLNVINFIKKIGEA